VYSSLENALIKVGLPYARGQMGDAVPGMTLRRAGVGEDMGRFDEGRHRVLAAHAAMAAAERECLAATAEQVAALGREAGLDPGMLVVFHAAPRGVAVWELDDRDCSREDAVLEAVDLADISGRRVRLTRRGLKPLERRATPAAPSGGVDLAGGCLGSALGGPQGRSAAKLRGELAPLAPVPLGGVLWQRAVLAWVDLHRALACWTGQWLAASLVVAPETVDVASLHPVFCPDRGQDFEVVTSLRLAPESVPEDDLEAALLHVLDESNGVTADLVELDLRIWLDVAGFELPGFPAHAPGECDDAGDGG
jgi:hypothetical protein